MFQTGRSKTFLVTLSIGVGLVIALIVAVWVGRPAYRAYKERRAMEQARAFLGSGDVTNGVLSLRLALSLNPANVEAVLRMADVSAALRSPQLLAWRRRAVELDSSPSNQLLLVTSGLAIEKSPYPLTSEALNKLAPAGQTNAEVHLLSGQLALQLKRPEDALRHLNQAVAMQPTNQFYRLRLATLQLQLGDAAGAGGARAELAALAKQTNCSLLALRALVLDALARKDLEAAGNWADALHADPQAIFADRLVRLTVIDYARPSAIGPAIAEAQQQAGTNVLSIVGVAQWMAGHGRVQPALEWLRAQPPELQESVPLLLAQAECYQASRDWVGLEAWLGGRNWKSQEYVRLVLLSRALREQGRIDFADMYWRRAMGVAVMQPQTVLYLYRLTSAWGWDEQMEQLLWAAYENVRGRNDWVLQALSLFYQGHPKTAGLYRLHQVLLERQPRSVPLQNNTAMLALLLDRDSGRALELAHSAYEGEKNNPSVVSTYAYALHMSGQTEEGLKLMATLTDEQLQQPAIALYQAVLLQSLGRTNQSKPYQEAAMRAPLLLPEEAALLESLQP